jgi:hypothetical protein
MPLWEFHDLQHADQSMHIDFPALARRFRQVGGVPGHLCLGSNALQKVLKCEKEAVNKMTKEQVNLIATGKIDAVGTLAENMPKSIVVGFKSPDGSTDFGNRQVVAISLLVEDLICHQHMKILWMTMEDRGKKFGWGISEAYT